MAQALTRYRIVNVALSTALLQITGGDNARRLWLMPAAASAGIRIYTEGTDGGSVAGLAYLSLPDSGLEIPAGVQPLMLAAASGTPTVQLWLV